MIQTQNYPNLNSNINQCSTYKKFELDLRRAEFEPNSKLTRTQNFTQTQPNLGRKIIFFY